MGKKLPVFYSALLLTGVNLLLRFAGTSFQVFLSGRIGAEGIGLLQLVLSVGTLAITLGMGGIRTASMYLSAEVLGQRRKDRLKGVLSGCIVYSLVLSYGSALLLRHFAPWICETWIGDPAATDSVRLLALFIPVNCLCGVMVGHFTGISRIGTLAAVEVVEQLFSMAATVSLLFCWAGDDPHKACQAVIFGSGLGGCFTLLTLMLIRSARAEGDAPSPALCKKLLGVAVPLALSDSIKVGINTVENLMVPKRLTLYPGEAEPLAAFGTVCGMVFPVLMFPAGILFGLTELLVPELARCSAAGSSRRIRHLAERSILVALIYGSFCGGILYLSADKLCAALYDAPEAGAYLRQYALLAPMLYCDSIADAVTKGLGQQKTVVRYNIVTSALDVGLLFLLLPRCGMQGYFISFLITHLINFVLSIRLLLTMTGKLLEFHRTFFALLSAGCGVLAALMLPSCWQLPGFCCVFAGMVFLLGVIRKKDLVWLKQLVFASRRY